MGFVMFIRYICEVINVILIYFVTEIRELVSECGIAFYLAYITILIIWPFPFKTLTIISNIAE